MTMNAHVAVIPDLNLNEKIEGLATTAGAYVGAGVTALLGGVLTAVSGLVRGATQGAQATHENCGTKAVPVVNTSNTTPVVEGGATITQAELQIIMQLREQQNQQGGGQAA
jgi:hypothetical protein